MVKKRYYHYPSPVAIDRFNTQSLRALGIKLSRDYLGFFGSLSKTYTRGDNKKKLVVVIEKVKKAILYLDEMVTTAKVTKKDVESVTLLVEEINATKDEFILASEENKALGKKIQSVEETTGISPADLNITKDIVKKTAAHTKRRTKEGAVSFMKRTMPGAVSLGGQAVSTATSMLGPFAPVAEVAGSVLKSGVGLVSGLREKQQERRELSLSRRLSPMSTRMPAGSMAPISRRRSEQPPLTAFGGVSKRSAHPFAENFSGLTQKRNLPSARDSVRKRSKDESILPLVYFFDKKAHKAKWTRELLLRFKNIEKSLGSKGGGALSLGGAFGGILKNLPLLAVGAAALTSKFALVAGGAAIVYKTFQSMSSWWKAEKGLEKSKAVAKDAAKMKKDIIIGDYGIQQYGKKTGRRAMDIGKELLHGGLSEKDYRAQLKDELQKEAHRSKGASAGGWGGWGPQVEKISKNKVEIEYQKRLTKIISEADVNRVQTGVTQQEQQGLEPLPGIQNSVFGDSKDLKKSMDAVRKAIEKMDENTNRRRSEGVKGASVGDPYGVGDSLLFGLGSGSLSVED